MLIELTVGLGAWRPGTEVVEAEIGLAPSDYLDPRALRTKLNAWWESRTPMASAFLFMAFAHGLQQGERHADLLALLEAFFGVAQRDYLEPERLAARLAATRIPVDFAAARVASVGLLAGCLGTMGRVSEATAVLRTTIESSGPTTVDGLARWASASGRAKLDIELATHLYFLGEHTDLRRESLALLERLAGLAADDYRDPERLRHKLRRLRSRSRLDFSMVFLSIVDSLLRAGRVDDAWAVVVAEIGAPLASLTPELLAAESKRRGRWLRSLDGIYLEMILPVLRAAYPPEKLCAALLLDAGLQETDWRDRESLSTRIEERVRQMAPSRASIYIGHLAGALLRSGRPERAAFLVDSYLLDRGWLEAEAEDPVLVRESAPLFEIWLGAWGEDAGRDPMSICRRLVPFLRKAIAELGSTLEDREPFLRQVGELRRRIVQTGLYWAERESDPASARDTRRLVLLWDLELAQQLLVERFLLTEIRRVPATDPPVAGRWPWPPMEGDARPSTHDYLPAVGEAEALAGMLDEIAAPSPPRTASEPDDTEPRRVHPYERLGVFARQGIDAVALATGLGPTGILLRATFDVDGRLIWTASASTGGRLEIAAHGCGAPGDLSRLRRCAARHDFRISYAHWYRELGETPVLREAGRRTLLAALREGGGVEAAPEPVRDAVAHLVRVLTWPDRGGAAAPAGETLRFADDLLSSAAEQPLWSELDGATAAFFQQVAAVWDLSPLGSVLRSDTDLVVLVDDALHAVPAAFMAVGGELLFHRIRSIRTSLAPALDLLTGDVERQAEESGPRRRRMLSISSFARDDRARQGGRWLHHGQLRLAEIHQLECLAGADREGGTVGAIRGALDRYGRFDTAAICGHGDFERAGIVLSGPQGQVLWDGVGCDLGGIDWLLLVSCSIGRVAQTGDLDVEGFCVRLVSHRARSIAACRWPVLSVQAAAFANEAVHRYLDLLAAEPRDHSLRARALNLARRRFSAEGLSGDAPLVGIHTAAAFELYGLG